MATDTTKQDEKATSNEAPDTKLTGARARAERNDDNSFVSNDVFAEPAKQRLLDTHTATDHRGTERITDFVTPEFTPAPVDPHPDEVKRLEALAKEFEDAKQSRLNQHGIDDKERATNNPADGGSQSVPQ